MYGKQPNPGMPGSSPLPVSGSPGMEYANLSKAHPSSLVGVSRMGAQPGTPGAAAVAGKK